MTPSTLRISLLIAGFASIACTSSVNPDSDTGDGIQGMFCADHCAVDDDCAHDGLDVGLKCTDSRCQAPECTDDVTCQVRFSGWFTPCAAQAGCPGQVCIDVGDGEGRCATAPSASFMCSSIPGSADVTFPAIEGGADLTVCADARNTCDVDSGKCVTNPCTSDAECKLPLAPKCDPDSGECGCASDADCSGTGSLEWSKCHDGLCGCASDADCAGSLNGTTCTARGRMRMRVGYRVRQRPGPPERRHLLRRRVRLLGRFGMRDTVV